MTPLETKLAEALREPIKSRITIKPNSCWIWSGKKNHGGYGVLGWQKAHRLVYEALKGPIPEGLHIDHLCRVRDCVNPDHLEAVTQAENNKRAGLAKKICKHGHPLSGENLLSRANGQRGCRQCQRVANNVSYARRSKAAYEREKAERAKPAEKMTDCPHGTPHRWPCVHCDPGIEP